jgi:hypothetical protein
MAKLKAYSGVSHRVKGAPLPRGKRSGPYQSPFLTYGEMRERESRAEGAGTGMTSPRHPSDAFPVERDALAAALVKTAILTVEGETHPGQLAQARADLDFAHRTLAEKVAQVAGPDSLVARTLRAAR